MLRERLQIARDPVAYARTVGVTVGPDCRFLGVVRGMFGSEPYLVKIGRHVTLTAGVRFVTHDGGVWVLRGEFPDVDVFGRVTIEDNVFIGLGVILLPGVAVGANSVVAAGSVVTRDIPANSIAAGVPCRPIGTVDDYKERVLAQALHVRSLSADVKRKRIVKHLSAESSTPPDPDPGGSG